MGERPEWLSQEAWDSGGEQVLGVTSFSERRALKRSQLLVARMNRRQAARGSQRRTLYDRLLLRRTLRALARAHRAIVRAEARLDAPEGAHGRRNIDGSYFTIWRHSCRLHDALKRRRLFLDRQPAVARPLHRYPSRQ